LARSIAASANSKGSRQCVISRPLKISTVIPGLGPVRTGKGAGYIQKACRTMNARLLARTVVPPGTRFIASNCRGTHVPGYLSTAASRLEHRLCSHFLFAPKLLHEGHNDELWPPGFLVLLFACFLAGALACQRFLYPFFLAGFQVEGVTFYFLDDVLGLHLPLEATQGVFE
jgi:hypothetical protein